MFLLLFLQLIHDEKKRSCNRQLIKEEEAEEPGSQ
jgi:hypothetical protein